MLHTNNHRHCGSSPKFPKNDAGNVCMHPENGTGKRVRSYTYAPSNSTPYIFPLPLPTPKRPAIAIPNSPSFPPPQPKHQKNNKHMNYIRRGPQRRANRLQHTPHFPFSTFQDNKRSRKKASTTAMEGGRRRGTSVKWGPASARHSMQMATKRVWAADTNRVD